MAEQVMDDLVAMCRLFSALEKEAVCCGSVSPAQCAVLQDLLGGALDVSTLANRAQVTKGGMTRLLDGLVKRALVVRGRDEEDRRRVVVALTADGKSEAERLRQLTQALINGVLAQFPEEEHAQAAQMLRKLRVAMDGLLNKGAGCC